MHLSAMGIALGCYLTLLGGIATGQEGDSTSSSDVKKAGVLLVQLEHVPVTEVASRLQQFVRGNDDVRVVPLTLSNSLLIAGVEGDDRLIVEDLVRLIDRKPPAVEVDVAIVQSTVPVDANDQVELSGDAEVVKSRIKQLEQAGALKVLEQLHLATIDNQLAQLQVGKLQPMARGVNFAGPPGSGRSTPSFTMENVGTVLTATSRVSGDDVMIEIAVEKSWTPETRPMGEGEREEPSFRPDVTQQLQIRSTVRVPKGQSVHLGGMTQNAAGEQSRISAIVTAKVIP